MTRRGAHVSGQLDKWIPGPFVVMTLGQHCYDCHVYIAPGDTAHKCPDGWVRCATCIEKPAGIEPTDIRQLMAGMRHEPTTKRQWRAAEAGAAAMDRDWEAKALPKFVNGGLLGADPHYRAAYELRYHELLRLFPIR